VLARRFVALIAGSTQTAGSAIAVFRVKTTASPPGAIQGEEYGFSEMVHRELFIRNFRFDPPCQGRIEHLLVHTKIGSVCR
jgi:hypothetical protein